MSEILTPEQREQEDSVREGPAAPSSSGKRTSSKTAKAISDAALQFGKDQTAKLQQLAEEEANRKPIEQPLTKMPYPTMHRGGMVKKTGPHVLKKGERVLTRAQAKRYDKGRGGVRGRG